MAGDTNKAPPGWERKVDEHGSVHLVRLSSYLPPATQQTSTATTTTPAAAPPTPDSNGDPFLGLIVLLVIIFLYFLPLVTAVKRGHRNRGAIGVMNLFLGWTGLGWVGALIWAFTANTETSQT